MNTALSKRLNGVDITKFIMAFAVLTIHTQALFNYIYPPIINWFIRLAVPFFFIASGFLTARGLNRLDNSTDTIKYLKNRAGRFGKMFLLWLLIYLPISLMSFNFGDISILTKDVVRYIVKVILTGESRLAWPLWYLYSSMITYLLLCVMSRYRFGKFLTLMFAVLIIIGSLVLPYLNLPAQLGYCAKGIFERVLGGLPYIVTGFLLYKYISRLTNIILALCFLALSYILFYHYISIFSLFGGAALFLISYSIILPDKSIYNKLNTISIWVYLTHMFNLIVIKVFLELTDILMDKFTLLFISIIFTFITSLIIYRLSSIKGLNWLRKLI